MRSITEPNGKTKYTPERALNLVHQGNQHTGWYCDTSSGAELVVTYDIMTGPRIGFKDAVTGNVTQDFLVSHPQIDVHVGKSKSVREDKFWYSKNLHVHDHGDKIVKFKVDHGITKIVTLASVEYTRIDPKPSRFTTLPVELRRHIWEQVLMSEERTLFFRKNFLYGIDLVAAETSGEIGKFRWNRINEICKEFSDDARFLEFGVNRIIMDCPEVPEPAMLKYLHKSKASIGQFLPKITFTASGTDEDSLCTIHGLLQLARDQSKLIVDIHIGTLSFAGQKNHNEYRRMIRHFSALRWAFRSTIGHAPILFDAVISSFRMGREVQHLDVDRVKFLPLYREQMTNVNMNQVMLACNLKTFQSVMRGFHTHQKMARDRLRALLEDAYMNGF